MIAEPHTLPLHHIVVCAHLLFCTTQYRLVRSKCLREVFGIVPQLTGHLRKLR
jgi:hypothetical protein